MTTTQANGEFLVVVAIAGLFALVVYLLLSIRDAERIHPYKSWVDYQATQPFEVPAEPGIQIDGITLDNRPVERGVET